MKKKTFYRGCGNAYFRGNWLHSYLCPMPRIKESMGIILLYWVYIIYIIYSVLWFILYKLPCISTYIYPFANMYLKSHKILHVKHGRAITRIYLNTRHVKIYRLGLIERQKYVVTVFYYYIAIVSRQSIKNQTLLLIQHS